MNRCSDSRPLVMAVASCGGHLVQLERILGSLEGVGRVLWVSTGEGVAHGDCIVTRDFSRNDFWMFFPAFFGMVKIIRKCRPTCVITTGAAPGIAAVIAARALGVRSLWIDSLANSESLSLSGRIAVWFATEVLTQWPHLAGRRVKYFGSIIS